MLFLLGRSQRVCLLFLWSARPDRGTIWFCRSWRRFNLFYSWGWVWTLVACWTWNLVVNPCWVYWGHEWDRWKSWVVHEISLMFFMWFLVSWVMFWWRSLLLLVRLTDLTFSEVPSVTRYLRTCWHWWCLKFLIVVTVTIFSKFIHEVLVAYWGLFSFLVIVL